MTVRKDGVVTKAGGTCAVALNKELRAALEVFRVEHGLDSPAQAVRYILRMFFASTPVDGRTLAERMAVHERLRNWMKSRVGIFLHELQEEIKKL